MSEATPPPPPPHDPVGPTGQTGPVGAGRTSGSNPLAGAHPYDLGIMAIGLLVFLLSLFKGYYTYDVSQFASGSFNAWHGFFGWFAALLALAGAVILVLPLLGVRLAIPTRLVSLGCFGVALICVIIAGLTWTGTDTGGADVGKYTGHGFTYWVSLILIIAGTALAFMRKDATD